MIEFKSKLRPWGNSFGIVVPKKILNEKNLNENIEVEVMIKTKKTPIEEAFGKLKNWKINPQKIKDQIRKEEIESEKRKFKK